MPDTPKIEQLSRDVAELREDLDKLTKSIDALVTAWNAAGVMVAIVKWTAGFVSAVLGAWYAWAKIKGDA